MGKGSKPRPFSVSDEEYAARWDAIFNKDIEDEEEDEEEPEVDDSCPVCRQDVMMLAGNGRYWKCGTCGHYEKPEPEEP
jgi:ribosomal protein S27AE